MHVKDTVYAIPLTSLSAASFVNSFVAINANGTNEACFLIKIVNNSNKDVLISLDGTNSHDFVPAGGFTLYDFQTNKQHGNECAVFKKGTVVYANGGAVAGTGAVYLIGWYQIPVNSTGRGA